MGLHGLAFCILIFDEMGLFGDIVALHSTRSHCLVFCILYLDLYRLVLAGARSVDGGTVTNSLRNLRFPAMLMMIYQVYSPLVQASPRAGNLYEKQYLCFQKYSLQTPFLHLFRRCSCDSKFLFPANVQKVK
jgi:hypothetical protein